VQLCAAVSIACNPLLGQQQESVANLPISQGVADSFRNLSRRPRHSFLALSLYKPSSTEHTSSEAQVKGRASIRKLISWSFTATASGALEWEPMGSQSLFFRQSERRLEQKCIVLHTIVRHAHPRNHDGRSRSQLRLYCHVCSPVMIVLYERANWLFGFGGCVRRNCNQDEI
jgi:hypothetical protein